MDFPSGWDSTASLVDGQWVDRRPRRPEVASQLRRETRLMPWLPLPVPVPHISCEDPLVVRHRVVPGEPLAQPTAEHGEAVGAFLKALHGCPAPDGLPDTAEDHAKSTIPPLSGKDSKA